MLKCKHFEVRPSLPESHGSNEHQKSLRKYLAKHTKQRIKF